ncbi:MAG: response regulator receiver modulated diguanylate cyclase with sensor [Deferribacteraceae bacterium]|jgi:diguanylate cyclase (GGDEF)-like protein/PAS domain S-box-containing protein|nr:response regulator receiver modulated diguanylate cyclase with sensor [Deferribacteraceae bacterium]
MKKILSELNFEEIFYKSPYPMALVDPQDFRIIEVNSAAIEFYGYTYKELLKLNALDITKIPFDGQKKRVDFITTKGEVKFLKHYLKDGSIKYVKVYGSIIKIKNKDYYFVTIHDVSDEYYAFEKISQLNEKLNIFVKNSYSYEFFEDKIENKFYFSDNFYEISKKRPDEYNNSHELLLDIAHKDFKEILKNHMCEVCSDSYRVLPIEIKVITKDNKELWILHICKPVLNSKNECVGVRGSNINITPRKELEFKLKQYLKYLNTAQSVSKTGSWHINIKKNVLWWSDEIFKIFGLPKETKVSLELFFERIHPDDREFVAHAWRNALEGKVYDIEHRIIVGNTIKWINEKAEIVRNDNNEPIEAIGTARDITSEKRLIDEIKKENRLIELLFDLLPGFLWLIDKDMIIRKQNKNAAERFGSKLGEKCYESIFCGQFISKQQRYILPNDLSFTDIKCDFCLASGSLEQKTEFSIEIEDSHNGKFYKAWWIPINEVEFIHYMIDITEQKESEDYFREMSMKDYLTKVYNRRYFSERFESELELAKRANRTFSLVIFDIDHFKQVNDTYGHNVGDTVLKRISELVKNRLRKVDVFARWGGEEFIILLPETKLNSAINLAENLRKMIEEAQILDDRKVTVSFGVTEYKNGDTVDSVVKRADDMLYKAKSSGRNRVEWE